MDINLIKLTEAYRDFILSADNTSCEIYDINSNINYIYYNWLKWNNGVSKLYNLDGFELDYLKELVKTKIGIKLPRFICIILSGDMNKSTTDELSEEEIYSSLGCLLAGYLNEVEYIFSNAELDELSTLCKASNDWVLPIFLKAFIFSNEGLEIKYRSNDFEFILGWFVHHSINGEESEVYYQLYKNIIWDFVSNVGFEPKKNYSSVALIRYLSAYDRNLNINTLKDIDNLLEYNYKLASASGGLCLNNGVTLVGMVNGELGIGEDIRQVAKCLESKNVNYSIYSFPKNIKSSQTNTEFSHSIYNNLIYDTLVFNLTAEETYRFFHQEGLNIRYNRYIIGYWPWELSSFPKPLEGVFDFIDEIWAPTNFIADSIRKVTTKPVYVMGLPVDYSDVKNQISRKKSFFSSYTDKFKVLTVFDGLSYPERKNAILSVKAFKLAFTQEDDAVLLIKTMNFSSATSSHFQNLIKEIGDSTNIHILDECLSRIQVIDLINDADVLVSLHRSEGFGRVPAEAMLLKTPVISSNYSGTKDFCLDNNSYLVDGTLKDVKAGDYPYFKEQTWFEPNVIQASEHLKNIFCNRDVSEKIENAFTFINLNYSLDVMSNKYIKRLNDIWERKFYKTRVSFCTGFYKMYNQDLSNIDYMQHLINYGMAEGRRYSLRHLLKKQTENEAETVVNYICKKKLLVTVHSYYMNENKYIKNHLLSLDDVEYDVVVNIPDIVADKEHIDFVKSCYGKNLKDIIISENRGRDVGGLAAIINHVSTDDYDIALVLQTKKSPQNSSNYVEFWKYCLFDSILGTKLIAQKNISDLRDDKQHIGLIGSAHWRSIEINENLENLNKLFNELDISEHSKIVEYLSGSVFFVRIEILMKIFSKVHFDDFEVATGRSAEFYFDGQLEHSIERVYGSVLKEMNLFFKWV